MYDRGSPLVPVGVPISSLAGVLPPTGGGVGTPIPGCCYNCSRWFSLAILRRRRRTPFPANTQYTTGTITSVIKVDTESPHATVIPIERHISAPSPVPIAIGIIPSTVVRVVINTGRRRDLPAATAAVRILIPRSRHRIV